MDYNQTGIICTKHRLWKHGSIVQAIIHELQNYGYQFKEVVLGEPNNFIFADQLNEVDDLFKKRGFYGIRIKMETSQVSIEINSNTDGVDNVQYTIYAETEDQLQNVIHQVTGLTAIIRPSNDRLASSFEWLSQHKQVRNIGVLVLIAIALYLLGAHIFLFNIVQMVLSFSPFLTIYILYLLFRRRR